eukprot:8874420-Alexandrium_andersonii.AAC.1
MRDSHASTFFRQRLRCVRALSSVRLVLATEVVALSCFSSTVLSRAAAASASCVMPSSIKLACTLLRRSISRSSPSPGSSTVVTMWTSGSTVST